MHIDFPRRGTGQTAKQQRDGTWRSVAEASVLKEVVTQPLGAYIEEQHATVAEWVTFRPILDFCDREMGFEGDLGAMSRTGGKRRIIRS